MKTAKELATLIWRTFVIFFIFNILFIYPLAIGISLKYHVAQIEIIIIAVVLAITGGLFINAKDKRKWLKDMWSF